MGSYNLTHLKELESEAIFVIREALSTAVYVTPPKTPVSPTLASGHSMVTPLAFLENWP